MPAGEYSSPIAWHDVNGKPFAPGHKFSTELELPFKTDMAERLTGRADMHASRQFAYKHFPCGYFIAQLQWVSDGD